jgi:hypothetical protein
MTMYDNQISVTFKYYVVFISGIDSFSLQYNHLHYYTDEALYNQITCARLTAFRKKKHGLQRIIKNVCNNKML